MKSIIVAKFGSELVSDDHGVDQSKIDDYAQGLISSYQPSQLIIVTSGAVNAGRSRIKQNIDKFSLVTLSQLGAADIVSAWQSAFSKINILSGGLLVTHNELSDHSGGPRFLGALEMALERNVVSIINENDALSDHELMRLAVGGDNDGLAAHIATQLSASRLLIFTAKGGIVNDSGDIIETIDSDNLVDVGKMLEQREASEYKKSIGRGGIVTKFQAAQRASSQGVEVMITNPSVDMQGESVTRFVVG